MNQRYKAFIENVYKKGHANSQFIIFIGKMKRLYLESINEDSSILNGHIVDHDEFTKFINDFCYSKKDKKN